ncbi:MAG: hypothetical protein R2853_08085 [Thermomicrobiales bacterium]|nr:hypothetical protein [Thermomicrobiales bacterium]
MPGLRAESRFSSWIAPLWILALIGLLFFPTEYRGGASAPHSHALLQLLMDAQDGQFLHVHAQPGAPAGFAYDWLDPAVADSAEGAAPAHPDTGGQQERASALAIITFLVVLSLLPATLRALPRIFPTTPRLNGRVPRVLAPPPRFAAISA